MYGPHNALEHLNRCYGDSWVAKGQVLFDHRTGKWRNTKPRNLSVDEFLTFKAPPSTCDSKVPEVKCGSEKNFFTGSKKSVKRISPRKSKKSSKRSRK